MRLSSVSFPRGKLGRNPLVCQSFQKFFNWEQRDILASGKIRDFGDRMQVAQCDETWLGSFGGIARFLVGNPWHAVTEFGGSIRIESLKQPKFNLQGFGELSK